MAPLGPLTTNRLTVRLDPERAARIEYWATENPLKIKSYNQLIQEALDEYLDRHTVSPTHDSLTVQIPQKVREKLHDLQEESRCIYSISYCSLHSISFCVDRLK